MHLLPVLSVLGLLIGTRASSLDSRAPASHHLDARQPILDVCATINAELAIPDAQEEVHLIGDIGEPILSSSSTCRHSFLRV